MVTIKIRIVTLQESQGTHLNLDNANQPGRALSCQVLHFQLE